MAASTTLPRLPSTIAPGNAEALDRLLQSVRAVSALLSGDKSWNLQAAMTGYGDAAKYALEVRNQTSPGKALRALGSGGGTLLAVEDTGITLGAPLGDTVVVDLLTVQTSLGAIKFQADAAGDAVYIGNPGSPLVKGDIANGVTYLGNPSGAGAASNAKARVVGGRLYASPSSEVYALGLGYSVAATNFFYLGASAAATPDLIASNNGGTQVARLTNGGVAIIGTGVSSALAAGSLVVGASMDAGAGSLFVDSATGSVGLGTVTPSSSYRLDVAGATNLRTSLKVGTGTVPTLGSGDLGISGGLNVGNPATPAGGGGVAIAGGLNVASAGAGGGDIYLSGILAYSTSTYLYGTATAGAAALPATPEGFFGMKLNGTQFKVPYYKP